MLGNQTKVVYGEGRKYESVLNGAMTFFVSQTNFDFAETEVGYLAGPPLHIHPVQDEIHYVLQGKLHYQIDQEWAELEAGNYLLLPKGTAHAWINLQQQPARTIAILLPGGSEGFFKTMSSTQLDTEAQLKLAQECGTEIIGSPLAAFPNELPSPFNL